MNILHHKSWHVYSAKNREKVAKDEEKAAKENEQKELEKKSRDNEAKLGKLRKLAQSKYQTLEHGDFKEPNLKVNNDTIESEKNLLVEKEKAIDSIIEEEIIEVPISIKKVENKDKESKSETIDQPLNFLNEVFSAPLPEHLVTKTKSNNNIKDNIKERDDLNYMVPKKSSKSWYLSEKEQIYKEQITIKNQHNTEITLNFNDPLTQIKKGLKKRGIIENEEKSSKNKKKHNEDNSNNKIQENDNLSRKERLRLERLKREKREREKSDKLLGRGSKNYHQHQFQYNPELNRKRY